MAEKTDCAYCAFVEWGADNFKGRNIGNRILFESKNFVVFPTIGQIVEGYLLIAPKKHFISIAAIPKSMFSELEKLQKKVRAVLEENYSTPLFFEHRPLSQNKKRELLHNSRAFARGSHRTGYCAGTGKKVQAKKNTFSRRTEEKFLEKKAVFFC